MPDRPTLLQAYLSQTRTKAFRPGRLDCALFAAGWVEQVTGEDIASPWEGAYSSMSAGRKMLRDQGYADHIALAEDLLAEISGWARAQTGDIAVVLEDEAPCFGIVSGGRIHVLSPGRGLDFIPLERAVRVFRP